MGDVATIVGGGTPSTNNDAYWDGDIDWYSPAELGEQVYADRSVRRITQAGYDSCSATLLPAGKTILFTSRAGIGNTAILRRSACTNQGFQSLVVNDDTDVYFVYSMTDRIKKFAEQKASGSTFLEISGKGLAAGEFAFPSKDEQTAIGSMFKQLDHLITLHQCKCQHCSLCGYLSWEQRKWSEYVSISTDMVDPRSGNYGNLPHVGPGNMESFTGRLYDNVNTVKDDALISGKFHFNPGDIIYGKINPQLGKYTYAQFEGLASADAYVLNGKNGLTQEFLFGILQTKAFFDYSVSVSMRSGMPKINRDELNAFEFLAPNESEQRAIGDILLKLDDLITLHR